MHYSPVITNADQAIKSDKLHLFRYVEDPNQKQIDTYMTHGGYTAWKKVLNDMSPEAVTGEVKESGLRGRGGAGFPTGVKWGFVPKDSTKPRYLICNADESEPGTCKDRVLMERDPHGMIEGMAIASFAIKSNLMFCYIRGEFGECIRATEAAMHEAYDKGMLGKNIMGTGYDLDMVIHTGGGAYICGEETALLNSLEGERGMSRVKPPFPAVEGLYACPTIVNNVETLAAVPFIVNNGAAWYKSMGTEKSAGTKLFSLTGHINRPGNFEVELGMPLKDMIYSPEFGNGIPDGKKLKAVIPGGASTPYLTPEQVETVLLDYESMEEHGSMLGSGAIIVLNEDTCIIWSIYKLIHFFRHESCGKCTPCREGTGWLEQIIKSILDGKGKPGDIERIEDLCENILGRTICPLGDAAVMPIQSAVKHFRGEWEFAIEHGRPMVKTDFAFT